MSFCTACGHSNSADNKFCDECGTALRATPSVSGEAPPHPAPQQAGASRRRGLVLSLTAASLVALSGVTAALLLADDSASPEHLQAAVDRQLRAVPTKGKDRYCLRNFAYDQDPVLVSDYDRGHLRLMAVLVAAGLYNAPEEVRSKGAFFGTRSLRYGKTPAGIAATSSGALCIAKGLRVKKVEDVREQTIGGRKFASAQVHFDLQDLMPWVQEPAARAAVPGLGEDFTEAVDFVPKAGRWEVATADDVIGALVQAGNDRGDADEESAGPLDRLLGGLFSAGNPVQGKWRSDIQGVPTIWEFSADALTTPSGEHAKVRYEIQGKTVNVFKSDRVRALTIQLVDDNNITIRIGSTDLSITATRVPQ